MKSPFRLRRLAAAAVVALGTALTGTALAAPAAAEELPEFDFADCPSLPEGAIPAYWGCTVVEITGGTFVLGNMEQPVESPIRMVYANGFDPLTFEQTVILESFEADWVMAQEGLWGDRFLTAVYAKPEAVGLDLDAGTIKMDLKLRVYNPVLGSDCTIGNDGNPISLNLTAGTTAPPPPNEPISGVPPVVVQDEPFVVNKVTMVDNAFAVPGADNCGIGDSGNWLVNLIAGTPADAGHNTAVFTQYAATKSYTEL